MSYVHSTKYYAALKENKVDFYAFKLKNSSVWRIFYSKLLIVVVPGSGEGTLLLKYFTIIYHKTIWFKYSIFEKKRHLQGTDRTLVTECESKWEGVREQPGLCGGLWLESLRGWATRKGVRGLLRLALEYVLWGATPWWRCWGSLGTMVGLCVAGRLHRGIGLLGVGATKNKHLILRRHIAQAPQILISETLYEGWWCRHWVHEPVG